MQEIYRNFCGSVQKYGLLYNDFVRGRITNVIKTQMNKSSIVDAVHAKLGGTKVQAEQAVETMIETIVNSLKGGNEVSIAGLGIFAVKQRKARKARNPRTGEMVDVAAMKVPKFRAAKALKDAVK
jgi:DNA-binding protein HU-beta